MARNAKGQGGITPHPTDPSKRIIKWELPRSPDGTRNQRKETVPAATAQIELNKRLATVEDQVVGKETFAGWANYWRAKFASKPYKFDAKTGEVLSTGIAQSSFEARDYRIDHFLIGFFGTKKLLKEITNEDVQTLFDALAYGEAPFNRVYGFGMRKALKSLLSDMFERAMYATPPRVRLNPCKFIDLRGELHKPSKIPVWTPEEVIKAMTFANDVTRWSPRSQIHQKHNNWGPPGIMILLACVLGVRRGELCGVTWNDLDWKKNTLTVGGTLVRDKKYGYHLVKRAKNKTSFQRVIQIPNVQWIKDMLKAHHAAQAKQRLALGTAYQNNNLICARGDGTPIHMVAFSVSFKLICKNAGVTVMPPKSMRHTHGTIAYAETHDNIGVGERMGHGNAQKITPTYIHVSDEKAIETANKIGNALKYKQG